jgi:hypothetical protein
MRSESRNRKKFRNKKDLRSKKNLKKMHLSNLIVKRVTKKKKIKRKRMVQLKAKLCQIKGMGLKLIPTTGLRLSMKSPSESL